MYEWFLDLLCLSNEQDQLRNGEPILSYLNDLPLTMHASQGTSPFIVYDPRCDFIEFDNATEIVVHQPMLGFFVANSVSNVKILMFYRMNEMF